MPKNKVSEWSSTAANNTDIGGINIAEGCAPSGINNAIRELMAQVKDMQAGSDADNFVVGGNLSVTGNTTLTNALPVTSGGTGIAAVTTGDILYSSSVNTLARLAGPLTTGSVLLSGTAAPSWGKVPLATHVSGQLPVANGGTGASSLTSKAVLVGNGTSAVSGVSPSSSGNVLVSDGTDWTSAALSTLAVFGKSLAENGYQKLPGGLIIQWGKNTVSANTTTTVTLPTTFASSGYIVVASPQQNTTTDLYAVQASISSTSQIVLRNTNGVSMTVGWVAIGV